MPEKRKKYDREFREGAVRIVEETNKPIAQVARDLGVNEGTLGNWVNRAREAAEGTRGCRRTTSRSSKGCVRRTPSCGWSLMSQAIRGPVGQGCDEVSAHASSRTRGPTTGCHPRSSAPLLGVSLTWFYKWLGRACGPGAPSGLHTAVDRRRETRDRAAVVAFRKARGLHGSP